MEFFQFHPTCLFHPQAKNFLISEALRGEGGILRNAATASAFMTRYDARADLAPRDIVARAIDYEMKRRGADARCSTSRTCRRASCASTSRNIYARCMEFGIDITAQPIPVVPAAHYMCGGVVHRSRTAAPRCPGCGPSASAPAPGSTAPTAWPRTRCSRGSCSVAARRCTRATTSPRAAARRRTVPDWNPGDARRRRRGRRRDAQLGRAPPADVELRRHRAHATSGSSARGRASPCCAGRDPRVLLAVQAHAAISSSCATSPTSAMLIVECARQRKESRGLHYILDYPKSDNRWLRDSVLTRGDLE